MTAYKAMQTEHILFYGAMSDLNMVCNLSQYKVYLTSLTIDFSSKDNVILYFIISF